MLRRLAVMLSCVTLLACEKLSPAPVNEGVASPNMKIPLSVLQLEAACEDVASIIMVSMSNRLKQADIYATRAYARAVANAFDARFPELSADVRAQTRNVYMQTANDQYLADDAVIQHQVETFRKYGENKFRAGAINVCKHGLANIPADQALPVYQLRS